MFLITLFVCCFHFNYFGVLNSKYKPMVNLHLGKLGNCLRSPTLKPPSSLYGYNQSNSKCLVKSPTKKLLRRNFERYGWGKKNDEILGVNGNGIFKRQISMRYLDI